MDFSEVVHGMTPLKTIHSTKMDRSVIVVFGLPGSGKSYFAEKLAEVLDASYISSDQIRKAIIPKRDYSLKAREKVYLKMLDAAAGELKNRKDVVMDGTFYLKEWRDMVLDKFQNMASCHFIEINASEELIKERTDKKRPFSDADFEVYKLLKQVFEPMQRVHLKMVSTNTNIEKMISMSLDYLQLKKERYGSAGD